MRSVSRTILVITILVTGAMITMSSCRSKKEVTGYEAVQKKPTTVEQQEAANRGVKLQKEECEEMALEGGDKLREFGIGVSDKESFAVNLALLDARAKLAQQLEALVNGLISNYNQQHEADKEFSSIAKAEQIQRSYFEQFLVNTRPVCKNTYVKTDGKYNVYVCIELGDQEKRALHKKLSDDKKIGIDFQEHLFLQELDKAKEDYRKQQNNR